MIIETWEDGEKIKAEIMNGPRVGHIVRQKDSLASDREQHAEAARQLADRPAVRKLGRTSRGYIFKA